jgi:hypothetical protein
MAELTELQDRVNSVVWYHSIDLGHGIVTDGYCKTFLEESQLPDFAGKHVLDIGAWDGFYSFQAERRGTARVVALGNWYTPTIETIHELCRAAGFSRVDTVIGPPADPLSPLPGGIARLKRGVRRRMGHAPAGPALQVPPSGHYRALVHA